MAFLRSVVRSGVPAAIFALAALTDAHDADACGGCFHPPVDLGGSVVTDHRMVFEITNQETILWDQVRYAGDPKQFAWVLPVRPGARVELSRGEWIAALDAATVTTVEGPHVMCPPVTISSQSTSGSSSSSSSYSGSSSSGSGGGCGGGGYSPSTESAPSLGGTSGSGDSANGDTSTPMFAGNDDVEVVAQSSIGPYQAVTIHASGTTGIADWLTANGFEIPTAIAPVIEAYTAQQMDFIALKLAPDQGVQAMRPIRVITPGADLTLPLRMVAAGVGANVGLTLWVIGEGRYHTQNFPDVAVDWSSLAWDVTQTRSNRAELELAALQSNGGTSWITEAAIHTSLTQSSNGTTKLPNVYDAYRAQCSGLPPHVAPCDAAALPAVDGKPTDVVPDSDSGTGDGDDSGSVSDDGGSADAGDGGGSTCTKMVSGCDGFDDLDVSSLTIHNDDVWITRLRADLPVSALATDLELAASADQTELSPAHSTSIFNPPYDPCADVKARNAAAASASKASSNIAHGGSSDGCSCRTAPLRDGLGTWLLIGLTMIALPLVARRKRRELEREGQREHDDEADRDIHDPHNR